jgi:hypothetical protein
MSVDRLRERIADSIASDPADRRGNAHVAVLGVRELQTGILATAHAEEARVVGSDRSYEPLAVPAVERELEQAFRSLVDADGTLGVRTSLLGRTGEAILSVRDCQAVTRGEATVGADPAGPVPVQPGTVFPFMTELRQPTFPEVLFLLACLANRDDYRGVYDAGADRPVRLTGDVENHVAMVVTNWKTAAPSARDLSRAVATALASRRTHGSFQTGDAGRYDYAPAAFESVVIADRPHDAADAAAALEHAIRDVVPFGATHGLNDVVGRGVVGPVVEAVTDRPRLVTDVLFGHR